MDPRLEHTTSLLPTSIVVQIVKDMLHLVKDEESTKQLLIDFHVTRVVSRYFRDKHIYGGLDDLATRKLEERPAYCLWLNAFCSHGDCIMTIGHEIGHLIFMLCLKQKTKNLFKKYSTASLFSCEEIIVQAFAESWATKKDVRKQLMDIAAEVKEKTEITSLYQLQQ